MSLKLQTANSRSVRIRFCAVLLLDNVFVCDVKTETRREIGSLQKLRNSESIQLSAVIRNFICSKRNNEIPVTILYYFFRVTRHRIDTSRVVAICCEYSKFQNRWGGYH